MLRALEEKRNQVESRVTELRTDLSRRDAGASRRSDAQRKLDTLTERYHVLSRNVDAVKDSDAEVERYELMLEAECILRQLGQLR